MRRGPLAAVAVAVLLVVSGCSQASDLADGLDGDYVSSDGSVQTISPDRREAPIPFAGETDVGGTVSSDDLVGDVVVLNFWYANCPPCRREAPDLAELAAEFAGQDVVFLGVNIRDSAEKARAFAEEFGIPYPSVLDAVSRDVVSAFAGEVPPSAVPTTLVLDTRGRVAARFTGIIESPSTLASVIETLVAEAS